MKETNFIAAPENISVVNSNGEEFFWDISQYDHPLDLYNAEIVADIKLQDAVVSD